MNFRIFVRKRPPFDIEEKSLIHDLTENLKLKTLETLAIYNIYDLFGAREEDLDLLKKHVLAEKQTDEIYDHVELGERSFAMEFLPGQYDQRSDSAMQCLTLVGGSEDVHISSGKLFVANESLSEKDFDEMKKYLINPVEAREKDLSVLEFDEDVDVEEVPVLEGFTALDEDGKKALHTSMGLAMTLDDLDCIQAYFSEEGRDPYETEIRVLDTYWSDHCRHTTFETALDEIAIGEGALKDAIEKSLKEYLALREETKRGEKPTTLMDMATIAGRASKKRGTLEDMEVTDEINACSIKIQVDVDGKDEEYLLMFKNETHNHPTEIEPFGGASTCLGGAIRDPLSGRSYVYQAMRITGAGDITAPIDATLAHKLPQRIISKTAARGYASYGNQIGLTAGYIEELYHPGYVAKRMEIGAVVGAAPIENVVRKKPVPGDAIVLLGGRTGRDGIGGATGSSKTHTKSSLEKSASEVQKGNAPEERKLQRLFRNPEATRLIKKANDFGAGGVSVAIGELADGIFVDLDKVPVKYKGLNPTELAISESQERMACVIAPENVDTFLTLAAAENLEATVVAKVTEAPRLVLAYDEKKYVDLSRAFLDTNGARSHQSVEINTAHGKDAFHADSFALTQETAEALFMDPNIAMQKGMVEMFDASIGKGTVLMPYGGKTQMTREEGMVALIPTYDETTTASVMTYGFVPRISDDHPYLSSQYGVVMALARMTALGADYRKARLTCQEYFERLEKDPVRWGKVTSALLGLVTAQEAFGTPAIGGKDSMSGTFEDLDVPPTLVTFAVTTMNKDKVIDASLKGNGYLYLVRHTPREENLPDYEVLRSNFARVYEEGQKDNILSASTIKTGGILEAVLKAAFGNKTGFEVNTSTQVNAFLPGSLLVETKETVEDPAWEQLGMTGGNAYCMNGVSLDLNHLMEAAMARYESIYPTKTVPEKMETEFALTRAGKVYYHERIENPTVTIPVFPGTNCEYDTAKSFEQEGACVEIVVFRNRTKKDVEESVVKLADAIDHTHILSLVGGFSAGDEPDGSGKFIANVLMNAKVKSAIERFLARGGLILGICNGFQALVKSGLLPTGEIGAIEKDSPTLFNNAIGRHISQIVSTKVISTKTPWMNACEAGDIYEIAVSHGEGRLILTEEDARRLFENGQVLTQYVDPDGNATMARPHNPNGSYFAIEGLISPNGQIVGKMGHTERYEDGLYRNIPGNKEQLLIRGGVEYYTKGGQA